MQQHIFGSAPWGPGEGPKGQISLNFNYMVNFKGIPTFMCVLTNKICKTYRMGFSFCRLGHAPGVELGVLEGQKFMVMWHIKNEGVVSRTGYK